MLSLVIAVLSLVATEVLSVQLDCDGVNSTYTVNGTDVTFTCNTTTVAVAWSVPPTHMSPDDVISFTGLNSVGQSSSIGGGIFNATYTQETPRTSILQFTVSPSLNGTSVICSDGGSSTGSCFILVVSPPQSPSTLTIASITYQSVLIQWSTPFNGGSSITQYHINVSPVPSGLTTCGGGQCTTTAGSPFIVTGLTPNVQYQFTVSAENSEGIGEGASMNVTTVGNVFPPLTDPPQLCLNYTDSGLMLDISWNCDISIPNATTPPLTNHTICINNTCSLIVPYDNCTVSVPVNCSDTYSVSVTLNNEVGHSEPSPMATISTDLVGSVMHSAITNESIRITYTSFSGCNDFLSEANISITLTNLNTSSLVLMRSINFTTGMIDMTSLNDSTLYMYALLVILDHRYGAACTTERQFVTLESPDGTIIFSPSLTLSSSLTSPTPSTTDDIISGSFPQGAIAGITVGVFILLLMFLIVIIGVIIVILFKMKPSKDKKKALRFTNPFYDTPTAAVSGPSSGPVNMSDNVCHENGSTGAVSRREGEE